MSASVTVHFLEMHSPSELKPKLESHGTTVQECLVNQFEFNRFLYKFVGASWQWTDRLTWTEELWQQYVQDDSLRTWVAYNQGAIAGYYELLKDGSDVQIAYFGLSHYFIGKGIGGYLLTQAIRSAWEQEGTKRVWVHTCSNDHPHALGNYKARGLSVYKVKRLEPRD